MATYAMMEGSSESSYCCNHLSIVWHNSIWNISDENTDLYTKDENGYFYDDFNKAISKYVSSDEYSTSLKLINEKHDETVEYIRQLRSVEVPDEYSSLYSEVLKLYDLYIKQYNLVTLINGSYDSFSNDSNELEEDINSQYQIIDTYLIK